MSTGNTLTHQHNYEYCFSEGHTIRGLKVAFADTPPRLRALEAGWRETRRKTLLDQAKPPIPEAGQYTAKEMRHSGASPPAGGSNGRTLQSQRDTAIRGPGPFRYEGNGAAPPTPPPTPSDPGPSIERQRSRRPRDSEARDNLLKASVSPQLNPQHIRAAPKTMHGPGDLAVQAGAASPFQPIASGGLIPTDKPVALVNPHTGNSIHVLTDSALFGIALTLDHGNKIVRIHRNGRSMDLEDSVRSCGSGAARRNKMKRLRLVEWRNWNQQERTEWKLVHDLVESFKRQTPKVKLFLPTGQIIISCSDPPDVIFSLNASVHTNNSRTTPGDGPLAKERLNKPDLPTTRETRVRLINSRITSSLLIDTSTAIKQSATGKMIERFRSKRKLHILGATNSQPGSAPPTMTRIQNLLEPEVVQSQRRVEPDPLEDAIRGLQLDVADVDLWSEVEKESVRRFYNLRHEWMRY